MKIVLTRFALRDRYTIGELSIDGKKFSDTLEPRVRGLKDSMTVEEILSRKIKGQTAIPTGTYSVSVETWIAHPKYKVVMLHGVKGFSGILVHNGATYADTKGCIIVGRNVKVGVLADGRAYMVNFAAIVEEALKRGETVTFTVQ